MWAYLLVQDKRSLKKSASQKKGFGILDDQLDDYLRYYPFFDSIGLISNNDVLGVSLNLFWRNLDTYKPENGGTNVKVGQLTTRPTVGRFGRRGWSSDNYGGPKVSG